MVKQKAYGKLGRCPRLRVIASTVSAILGSGAVSGIALAQQQQGELEEIVVTGSRIVRRDFTAASPIITIGSEAFENISTLGVETALNQMPQFVPGGAGGGPGSGTQFGVGDVQSTASNSPGISVLNLRGLGPNRNLVLIDGRRAQPSNATLVIDVNTIPAAAIQSVEVITGGASAVYGADAIGGVVNFRLRNDFEGVAFDFQTSAQNQSGGEESRFSALFGGNFGEGGNAMLGMEWAKRNEVMQADRDFYVEGWLDPGTPAFGGPSTTSRFDTGGFPPNTISQGVIDSLFPTYPPGSVNQAGNFYFNDDGTVFTSEPARNYKGPLEPLRKIENDGGIGENSTFALVSSPLERYSLFGRAVYDISDNVQGFVQGNFTSVAVDQVLFYSPATLGWGATIPRDGRALPADLTTLLNGRANPAAPWALTRDLDFIGPRSSDNDTTVYQIQVGLEGDLGAGDWTYEAYFSHGETDVKNSLGGFASTLRYQAVVQAPNFGEGYVNAANSFLGYQARCTTGLPIFESFTPSQDCLDAIMINMTNTTFMEQDILEANFQGKLADMRTGELRAAFGVSSRDNSVAFTPDPLNDAEQTVDRPIGLFAANDTGGSTKVEEIYGELLVPITSGLNLELGLRSSDYNTTGRIETYKALFDWSATDSVRFRGGRQVANRAPNTAELYQGRTQFVVGFFPSDPCAISTIAPWGNLPTNPNRAQMQALCSAIINAPPGQPSTFDQNPNAYNTFFGYFPLELESAVGNPLVQNEEAETYTLGVVFQRESWSAAVDVYSIEIQDAISPVNALTTYEQCFNANGTSNPSYSIDDPGGFCRNIVRDPQSGGRLQVNVTPVNVGGIKTSGVDVQFDWNAELGPGNLSINTVLNYLDSYETQDTPSSPFRDAAGTLAEGGQFEYRLFTSVNYRQGSWSLGTRFRYLPSADDESIVNNPNTTLLGVEAYEIVDLYGSWQIGETVGLRYGIDNLFDSDPEIVGENPGVTNAKGTTNPGFYDVLGQRFYVGVNFNF